MRKLLVFTVAVLLSTQAISSGYLVPLGQGIEIQKIHGHEDGGITIWVNSGDISNPDGCDDDAKLHIRDSTEGYDTMVSLVLAAYMSDKKIGLWSTGCAIIPFWGGGSTRPIVTNVWITD